jgi:hypothetical protein
VSFRKGIFTDKIKALQIRSSWIIPEGPKLSDKCLERHTKGNLRHRVYQGHTRIEAEGEVMWPPVKGTAGVLRVWKKLKTHRGCTAQLIP